jgi:tetratricopeptide (TPR) repeat protein
MRKKICLFVLVLFCLSSVLISQEAEDPFAEGDELCAEMTDMETAQKVLGVYEEALKTGENKYEAYWRIAKMLYYIGDHTESKKEKKAIFEQGVYNATKAVSLESERPEGHYWLGVNHGMVGDVRGVLKSLSLVKPIKEAMNKVIELDRSYAEGGADKVLGRVYFKLPGFAGGDNDKSLEHLLKSLEYGPDDAGTHFYLAETYLALKDKDKAKAELELILNMEDDPKWTSDVATAKKDAKELLDKKFK